MFTVNDDPCLGRALCFFNVKQQAKDQQGRWWEGRGPVWASLRAVLRHSPGGPEVFPHLTLF